MNVLNCKNPFAALQGKRHLRYIVIHDVRSRHITSRQVTTSRHVIHDIREASIQSITSRHVTTSRPPCSSPLLPRHVTSRHVTSQRQPYHVTSGVRHHHGRLQGVTSRHVTTSAIPCIIRPQAVTSRQDVRRPQSGPCSV